MQLFCICLIIKDMDNNILLKNKKLLQISVDFN